jgi:hypothetical protein
MTLLLKWLHPDLDRRSERSIYARRVTTAWNDLKTPVRRSAYDERRLSTYEKKPILRRNAVRTRYYPAAAAPELLGHDAWRGRARTARCRGRVMQLWRALLSHVRGRRYC